MAGVGAGTGALGSVIVKLATLLGDEYTMLKRVRKDIAFLERELRRMQILVNVLADMEGLDKVAKDWKGSMRDLSYDMEECIDRFMLRLGNGEANPGFAKRTARQLKTLFTRHGIGTQIKELKVRITEESERRRRLNLDNYVPTTPVVLDPRLAAFHGLAKGLVAMEGRRDEVISLLKEERVELKVVAIVGGGGLGKTTLAMEAYRKIGGDFQCRAHVTVSRTLDPEKLLEDVLSQIDEAASTKYQSERWKKDQLIREIQRILTGKRYFFVIDDVWKHEHWEFVRAVFRDNNNGSRVVVTTRITKVAKSCCLNSGDQLYQMQHLNVVDSRRLFFKRIFHSENSCPTQLEDVSARILRKCGGVPLAIITITSMLANKPQNPNEWERLQDSIGTGLSYESNDEGKEDWYIPCEELKWKWISEGFIATKQGNLYQEAESYLNELVNRGLIQLVFDDISDGFEQSCQVHDMVLDLIISLSVEENFATVSNGHYNSLPSKIHRISLQSSENEQKGAIQAITRSKLHVRSLSVFGEREQIPPLVDFQSLRVFDLCGDYFSWENKLIRNIGSFYQLRYLRIKSRGITKLPEDIRKLQNLETLDLKESGIKELPSTIARLQNLVRLFVSGCCVLSADMFGTMRALEEVSDIRAIDNPEKFLEELGHLTKLRKITMTGSWTERHVERLASSLKGLGNDSLQYLYTLGKTGEYLFRDPCCTFPHLQNLKLEFSMGRVPKGMASLTNIVKLDIAVHRFDDEGLHILMGMPSLAYLRLSVSMSSNILSVSSNGFKLLEVFNCTIGTTDIKFAAGAMPVLRGLYLCWKINDYPYGNVDVADMGFEHLLNLADLQVKTDCYSATFDKVETLEGSVEKVINLHPNRHTLQLRFSRAHEEMMYYKEQRAKDDEYLKKLQEEWNEEKRRIAVTGCKSGKKSK